MESGFKSGWNLVNFMKKRCSTTIHNKGFVFPWVLMLLTLFMFTTMTTLDFYLNDVRLTQMEKQAVIKQNIFEMALGPVEDKWNYGNMEETYVYDHPNGAATAVCKVDEQLMQCQWSITTLEGSKSYYLTHKKIDPPP